MLYVQTILALVMAVALAGAVIVYFCRDHLHEKKLQLRVKKLYGSQLFEDMVPMLRIASRHSVEQVEVDKTGIVIRYLEQDSMESAFLMRPNGYAYLTPEQQEAVRVMLEECITSLADTGKYRVSRKRIRLVNGDIEYAYHYVMTNSYKAMLCRAPYYNGRLQGRSW